MSDYATTPETYAAWRYLEDDDTLRPHDREHAEMMRGGEELALLYSGTRCLVTSRLRPYSGLL